jgi:hypothetical protein
VPDWERGLVAGLLASLPVVLLLSAFFYVYVFSLQLSISGTASYVDMYGVTVTYGDSANGVLLSLLSILGNGATVGCLMGLIFAVYHEPTGSAVSARNAWKYGLLFSIAEAALAQLVVGWVSPFEVIVYLLVMFLASVFLFGSLLGRFWNKKLYFHGYWGMK